MSCKQELSIKTSLSAAEQGTHRVSSALKARASALRELLQRTSRCRRVNMMSSLQLHSCVLLTVSYSHAVLCTFRCVAA